MGTPVPTRAADLLVRDLVIFSGQTREVLSVGSSYGTDATTVLKLEGLAHHLTAPDDRRFARVRSPQLELLDEEEPLVDSRITAAQIIASALKVDLATISLQQLDRVPRAIAAMAADLIPYLETGELPDFATPAPTAPPRCPAHGEVKCPSCSRNDGRSTCGECDYYNQTGMHWDTCPNRVRP